MEAQKRISMDRHVYTWPWREISVANQARCHHCQNTYKINPLFKIYTNKPNFYLIETKCSESTLDIVCRFLIEFESTVSYKCTDEEHNEHLYPDGYLQHESLSRLPSESWKQLSIGSRASEDEAVHKAVKITRETKTIILLRPSVLFWLAGKGSSNTYSIQEREKKERLMRERLFLAAITKVKTSFSNVPQLWVGKKWWCDVV